MILHRALPFSFPWVGRGAGGGDSDVGDLGQGRGPGGGAVVWGPARRGARRRRRRRRGVAGQAAALRRTGPARAGLNPAPPRRRRPGGDWRYIFFSWRGAESMLRAAASATPGPVRAGPAQLWRIAACAAGREGTGANRCRFSMMNMAAECLAAWRACFSAGGHFALLLSPTDLRSVLGDHKAGFITSEKDNKFSDFFHTVQLQMQRLPYSVIPVVDCWHSFR